MGREKELLRQLNMEKDHSGRLWDELQRLYYAAWPRPVKASSGMAKRRFNDDIEYSEPAELSTVRFRASGHHYVAVRVHDTWYTNGYADEWDPVFAAKHIMIVEARETWTRICEVTDVIEIAVEWQTLD